MIVISARSPYHITINESGQTGSKVELFIWNKGTTEPTVPIYTLSESIASVTQTQTNYNISPYVAEYINQVHADAVSNITYENDTDWCLVKVKRYKLINDVATLLNTVEYVGVNGFTQYLNGVNLNKTAGENYLLLANESIKNQWNTTATFYNFLVQRADLDWKVKYYDNANVLLYTETFLTAGAIEFYNFRIPLVFTTSVKAEIENSADGVVYTINTEQVEECKYTPVNCSFVNSFGGWQNLVFFKAKTNSITVKSSEYNLMQENVSYDIHVGQKRTMNTNGNENVKLNTGWVAENYKELMHDLLCSEIVLLNDEPVTVKTQSLTYKTQLKDKMINYEIEFDYAFNLLNNVS